MVALGGELTLRETAHQIEALRRADEALLKVVGYCETTAIFRRSWGGPRLTDTFFQSVANTHSPMRGAILSDDNYHYRLIGMEMGLRKVLGQPAMASGGAVGRDLREMTQIAVGPYHSVIGLQHAITRRRACFHPDRASEYVAMHGRHALGGYRSAHLMFDAMAQVAQNPRCQRALFPRGDRWVGPYTREAAMRDLKLAPAVLGYLAAMTIIAALHFLSRLVDEMATDITHGYLRLGLQMPNSGEGNPQMLALPAA